MFLYSAPASGTLGGYAIVADRTALFLAGMPNDSVLTELWSLVQSAQFSQILAEILRHERSGATDFALFALSGGPSDDDTGETVQALPSGAASASIAVGGGAQVRFDNAVPFLSPGRVATAELPLSEFSHVQLAMQTPDTPRSSAKPAAPSASAVAAEPAASAALAALPIVSGIVRCASVSWSTDRPRPVTAAPMVSREPAPVPAAAADDSASETAAQPFDRLFEHTQFVDVEAAAVRTVVGEDPKVTDPASSGSEHLQLELLLSDGSRHPVDRPVLVGRRPEVPRDADLRDFQLIRVTQHANDLSRLHARFDPVETGVLVTDLGSTNGTLLVDERNGTTRLTAHQPQLALPGHRVILTKTLTITIEKR